MTHSFDPALIEVVGVKRPELEVPHDLRGRIGIIGVDQWKRQAGDITLEIAIRSKGNLRRVLFGGGFVGRRPVEVAGRNYLHRHTLPDEGEVPGTDQAFYF